MASASHPESRSRARARDVVIAAVLLALIVPLVVLDVEIPFYGAAGMVLVAAGIIYSVERWEDPARAQRRWAGPSVWTAALVLALVSAAGAYILLLG
jgi:hypothetical protein